MAKKTNKQLMEMISDDEAARIAKESFDHVPDVEDLIDPFNDKMPQTVEELQQLVYDQQARIEGLEEVIRINKKSYIRMKVKYHSAELNYHSESIDRLERDLAL